jgi:hypothetical protein
MKPCSYPWCPYAGRTRLFLGHRVVYRACRHHVALYRAVVATVSGVRGFVWRPAQFEERP